MSKLVLGLDIGVNSVGFALITESKDGNCAINKMGVRIVSEDPNFHGKFHEGNSASKNKSRRDARSARRNIDRYQLRRDQLIKVFTRYSMMPDEDLLLNISSLELYELRAKALEGRINLPEIGRILYHLNQKRGFKSSRKSSSEEEELTDYKQRIADNTNALGTFTIGQFFYSKLKQDPFYRIKENLFYRSEYQHEFDSIWEKQRSYYPEILTGGPTEQNNKGTLYQIIRNKIVYYQRPLKSAKHLIGKCTFETKRNENGELIYAKKVMPKSHPLFQEFRLWQQINNLKGTDRENNILIPNDTQRMDIWRSAHNLKMLDANGNLTSAKIKKLLEWPKDYSVNYEKIEGNKTWRTLTMALTKSGSDLNLMPLSEEDISDIESSEIVKLWHCTYSFDSENDTIRAIVNAFGLTEEKARTIAKSTAYTSDYGNISARAAKRILPALWKDLSYDKAVIEAGYEHHSHFVINNHSDKLQKIRPNSLKNPVVEQILNQVVNVVNNLTDEFGKPNEVRVELARELKNNAAKRKKINSDQRKAEAENKRITELLIKEHGFKRVNGRDLLRYRLWLETEKKCLYCGQPLSFTEVYNGTAEIEHIVPRSRLFSNAMSNLILAHANENREKGQLTAIDYLDNKGEQNKNSYIENVNKLLNEKLITRSKHKLLLTTGENISNDFLDRQLNDTQYIAKEVVSVLKKSYQKVYTTTGSVTDLLKEKWQLNHLLEEINLPLFRKYDLTEYVTVKDRIGEPRTIEKIKNFTKRSDHRHHAVDALVIALTKQSYIQRLNSLNQNYQTYNDFKNSPYDIAPPAKDLREQAKKHLETLFISFKKPGSKVLTKKTNKIKTKKSGIIEQVTWVPRGSLHDATVHGKIKRYLKSDWKTAIADPQSIINHEVQAAVLELIKQMGDEKKALNYLKKNNLQLSGIEITQPLLWQYRHTKRVALNDQLSDAKIQKILNPKIRKLIEQRVDEAGSIKQAFKEYATNPIWFDDQKKNPIKTVTVFDDGNLESIRDGYVYLQGNHHSLIYRNEEGAFKEKIVSFWEAVAKALENLRASGTIYPIIDRKPIEEGFHLWFSMQINDLFLFDVDPQGASEQEMALALFRLQTISKKDYRFRHQYQTTIDQNSDFAFKRIRSLNQFDNLHKIRLSNTGNVIKIGE